MIEIIKHPVFVSFFFAIGFVFSLVMCIITPIAIYKNSKKGKVSFDSILESTAKDILNS